MTFWSSWGVFNFYRSLVIAGEMGNMSRPKFMENSKQEL